MLPFFYSCLSNLNTIKAHGLLIICVLLFSPQSIAIEINDDFQKAIKAEQSQHFANALDLYQKALLKARQTNQLQQQVDILYALIRLQQQMNQESGAFETVKQLENLAVSIDNPTELMRIYRTLAIAYQSTGNYSIARDYYAVAVETAREQADNTLLAQLLNEQGFLDTTVEDYKSALISFEESLDLYKKLHLYSNVVDVSLNQIHAALKLRQKRKVVKLLNQLDSNILKFKIKLKPEQWIRRGIIFRAAHIAFNLPGRFRKNAFQSYQHAIDSSNNINQKATATGYIGQMYADEGRYKEAIIYTEKALSILTKTHILPSQFKWQIQLARVYHANNQISNSLIAYETALSTFRKLPFKDYVIKHKRFLSEIEPMFREYLQLTLEHSLSLDDKSKINAAMEKALSIYHWFSQYEKKNYCQASCGITITQRDKLNTREKAFITAFQLSDGLLVIASINENLFYHKVKTSKNIKLKISHKNIYRWMVKPFILNINRSNIRELIFMDNHWLPYIPYTVAQKGNKYLIQDYAITVVNDVHIPDTINVKHPLVYTEIVNHVEPKNKNGKQIDFHNLRTSYSGILDLTVPVFAEVDYRESYLKFDNMPIKLTKSFFFKNNKKLDLLIARNVNPNNNFRLQQLLFSMISAPVYIVMNDFGDRNLKNLFVSEFLSKLTSVDSYALAYQYASQRFIKKYPQLIENTLLLYQ